MKSSAAADLPAAAGEGLRALSKVLHVIRLAVVLYFISSNVLDLVILP